MKKPMNDKPCKNCGSYGGNVGCDVCGPPIREREAQERLARTACSGLECLSVWLVETIRWDANHEKGNHSEAYIVAKDIKAVWKWLAIDLSDEGVEIRSIIQKAPVLAVIPNIQNA